MKKLLGSMLALLLTASFSTSALAAAPMQVGNSISSHMNQKCTREKGHGLESFLKSSLERNNNDLTKVKQDLEKHLTEKRAARDEKLAKIAKKKGITVEELKKQISEKRQARLERKAKEKGLTTEQLKQEMIKKHQQKMESMAKNLGLTTQQLEQILPAPPEKS